MKLDFESFTTVLQDIEDGKSSTSTNIPKEKSMAQVGISALLKMGIDNIDDFLLIESKEELNEYIEKLEGKKINQDLFSKVSNKLEELKEDEVGFFNLKAYIKKLFGTDTAVLYKKD